MRERSSARFGLSIAEYCLFAVCLALWIGIALDATGALSVLTHG
jgi:hypothetical protein